MTEITTLYFARFGYDNKLTVVPVKVIETKAQFRLLEQTDGIYRTRLDKIDIGKVDRYCQDAWGYTAKQALMVLKNGLYKKNAGLKEEIDRNIIEIDIIQKMLEATDD
jgi:hypothetical protein